jgi:cytochrome c oxidase subunit 4
VSDEATTLSGEVQRVEERVEEAVDRHVSEHDRTPAPGLLPGELSPHPSPFKYVMIAVILVVITAVEVATSYLEGTFPDYVVIGLLLFFAAVKFFLVGAYYMHLRTDRPIFRRFFILGIVAAIVLYAVVLLSLHIID